MIIVFIRAPGSTLIEVLYIQQLKTSNTFAIYNHLQKLKSSIQSDLIDKCPKCGETDCDCVIRDEELGPMLVMQAHPEIRRDLNMQVLNIPYNTVYRSNYDFV